MRQALVSLNNCSALNINTKGHKHFAYSHNFKFYSIDNITEIFNLWSKLDTILVCNSFCILNQLNTALYNSFVTNTHKQILLGSIEHLPLYFDAFFIKTTIWSKIFLSEIIRAKLYVDEYTNRYDPVSKSIKQFLIHSSFRNFAGESGSMVYNTIMEPESICLELIQNSQKKIGLK